MYQSSCKVPRRGYWCRPTIFTGVSQSNRIVQEEIFGPVLAVQTFRTLQEGLDKANNTQYGLSGGVWTDGSSIADVSAARGSAIGPCRIKAIFPSGYAYDDPIWTIAANGTLGLEPGYIITNWPDNTVQPVHDTVANTLTFIECRTVS